MPNFIPDPNMGFPNPVPTVDPGADYAFNLQASLTTIGAHDHTSGKGVPITPQGMSITTDLPMNDHNLTLVKTINFLAQPSTLAGVSPNLGCVYVSGNELYYNDEAGNIVQITNNGVVNSGAGSISGLPSGTASASYSAGSQTFVWQSATNTAANMDGGSFIFREVAANAKGVTVSSPTSLSADYQMFWPTGLPGSRKIMSLDASGNIAAVIDVDNSTLQIATNTLQVKDAGITSAKLAPGLLTALGTATVFTTSGTFTVPAGVNYIRVVGCGGGGGGAGGDSSGRGGGGGGGAGVFEGVLTVIPGDVLTVTVGTGGAGGAPGVGGGNGLASSITGTGVSLTMGGAAGGTPGSVGGAGGSGTYGTQMGTAASVGSPGVAGVSYLSAQGPLANGSGRNGAFKGAGGGSIGDGGAGGGSTGVAGGIGAGGGGGDGGVSGANGASGGNGQVTIYVQ